MTHTANVQTPFNPFSLGGLFQKDKHLEKNRKRKNVFLNTAITLWPAEDEENGSYILCRFHYVMPEGHKVMMREFTYREKTGEFFGDDHSWYSDGQLQCKRKWDNGRLVEQKNFELNTTPSENRDSTHVQPEKPQTDKIKISWMDVIQDTLQHPQFSVFKVNGKLVDRSQWEMAMMQFAQEAEEITPSTAKNLIENLTLKKEPMPLENA
jgi:hypothetical protein